MHNPFRSYRLLVPGLLAVALVAVWTPAHAQTADATRRNETALTSADAQVPAGPQGRRYTQTFTASGGVGPYAFEVTGNIPAGMRWIQAENGLLLDGVPLAVGKFPLTVRVTDSTGQVSTHNYVMNVTPADTGSSVNIPVTEGVTTTDVPVVGFPVMINVNESVATSDVPSVFFPVTISVTEAVTTTDVPAVFFPVTISVNESVTTSDVPAVFFPLTISVIESVTTTDAVAFGAAPVVVTVNEPITVTDTVSFPTSVVVTVNEPIMVTDTVSFGAAPVMVTVNEPISVTDTVSFGAAPVVVTVNEPIMVMDTVSFGASPVMVSVSELITVTDTVSLLSAVQVNVSEPISVTDTVSVTPVQAAQSIMIGTLPTPVYGGAPFNVSATATSGLPVTIAYVSGPATGSGSGPYTATGAGVVNFTATQAGNGSYAAAAPVNFSVTVGASSQTINIGTLPTPVYGGSPFSVSATATSGLPVTITETSGPATGSGSGPYTATGGGVVNFTATQGGNANYAAAAPVNFSVTVAPEAQTINVGTLPTPTYGGSPFSVTATATSGLPVTIAYVSGPATGSGSGPYTATGGGVVNFTATQAGNANYAAAAPVNFSVTVAAEAQTINVGTLPTPTYGGAAFSVSATATSGLPVTITRTSGPATGSGGGPYTATGAGTVNFTAMQAGNSSYLAAAPVNFSVAVAKQASVTAVGASPTSITPVQTTTLTATVSAAVTGSPTGTVTFFDNGVPIGSAVPVVGGQAQLTTLLLSGAQVISATYSGDANFVGSSSTANATVTVAPLDFTMTPLSPVSLNVVPGSSAVVSFNVTPLYLIYPGPVSFSVTGLPSNATYTVTPTSVAANGGPQTVTVTIQTAAATVRNVMPSHGAPIALALFVPLLALGALRRRKRWLSLVVLVLGVVAGSAVVGCGTNSGNGFFGQSPQTYPVVITATSGTVQHTINVSLLVQ
jgi:hypothetical protein